MKRKKVRDASLIQDECLACLGFYAYRTERVTRDELINTFSISTRLDEFVKGSRKNWWKFKFDNIHYAFKPLEGQEVRGKLLAKTTKGGLVSGEGLQQDIRTYSLNYFLNDFTRCVELARLALDASLPKNIEEAVFADTTGNPSHSYMSPDDIDAVESRSSEGLKKLRQHWYLERDSSLPRKAKAEFIKVNGELFCEACGVRPVPTYGHPIVDAHHRLPLSKYKELGKNDTALNDFAILCPNCHRAVHRHEDCDINEVIKKLGTKGLVFRDKSK